MSDLDREAYVDELEADQYRMRRERARQLRQEPHAFVWNGAGYDVRRAAEILDERVSFYGVVSRPPFVRAARWLVDVAVQVPCWMLGLLRLRGPEGGHDAVWELDAPTNFVFLRCTRCRRCRKAEW